MTKSDKAELEDHAWRACKGALNTIWNCQFSWCFREPVDEEKHGAPNYYSVIKDPQDLLTIKNRLDSSKFYKSPLEVDAAVRRMCENAFAYNAEEHDVHKSAKSVLAQWTELWEGRKVAALWAAAQDPVSRAALLPMSGRRAAAVAAAAVGAAGSGQQQQQQQPTQPSALPKPPRSSLQQQPQAHRQKQPQGPAAAAAGTDAEALRPQSPALRESWSGSPELGPRRGAPRVLREDGQPSASPSPYESPPEQRGGQSEGQEAPSAQQPAPAQQLPPGPQHVAPPARPSRPQQQQQQQQPRAQEQQHPLRPPQQQPRHRGSTHVLPPAHQHRPLPLPPLTQQQPGERSASIRPRKRSASGRPEVVHHPPLTPLRILHLTPQSLSGRGVLDYSPVPLLLSLLRAATWLPQLFLTCGRLRAQLLGGRTSDPELLLVRCLCPDCALQPLPGYMPLTHYYMHARGAEGEAAGLDELATPCTSDGEGEAGGPGGGGRGGGGGGGAGPPSSSLFRRPGPGPSPSRLAPGARVRVADMECLKQRVWGSLRCGSRLDKADEVPFLDRMRHSAEAGGGASLVGRRVWVYHFSDFLTPPNNLYGTWQPAAITSYNAETGEHELRYERDPCGPVEIVHLATSFLHFGDSHPAPGFRPVGPNGEIHNTHLHVSTFHTHFANPEGEGAEEAPRATSAARPAAASAQSKNVTHAVHQNSQARLPSGAAAATAALAAAARHLPPSANAMAAAMAGPQSSTVHLRGLALAATAAAAGGAPPGSDAANAIVIDDEDSPDAAAAGALASQPGGGGGGIISPFSQRQAALATHQQRPTQHHSHSPPQPPQEQQPKQQRSVYFHPPAGPYAPPPPPQHIQRYPPQPQPYSQTGATAPAPAVQPPTVTTGSPPGVAVGPQATAAPARSAAGAAATVAAGGAACVTTVAGGRPSVDDPLVAARPHLRLFLGPLQPVVGNPKVDNNLEYNARCVALRSLMTPKQKRMYDGGTLETRHRVYADLLNVLMKDPAAEHRAFELASENKRCNLAAMKQQIAAGEGVGAGTGAGTPQQQVGQPQQPISAQPSVSGAANCGVVSASMHPQQPQQQQHPQPGSAAAQQPPHHSQQQQQHPQLLLQQYQMHQYLHQNQQQQAAAAAAAAEHQQWQLQQHNHQHNHQLQQLQQLHRHHQHQQQAHLLHGAGGSGGVGTVGTGVTVVAPPYGIQVGMQMPPYNVMASRPPPGTTAAVASPQSGAPHQHHQHHQALPPGAAAYPQPQQPGGPPAHSLPPTTRPQPQPQPGGGPVQPSDSSEQQAKRPRLDSGGATRGGAGAPMAAGAMPPGSLLPQAAQQPLGPQQPPPPPGSLEAQLAQQHSVSPPSQPMPAAAASSGGRGSVSGGAGDETAAGGTGSGAAAAAGGGGGGSRFRPMPPELTDVVEITRVLLELMEQVPLNAEEGRGVRKALRQLQAAGRDSRIRIMYMMLCTAAKAGYEEEIRDIFDELRREVQ